MRSKFREPIYRFRCRNGKFDLYTGNNIVASIRTSMGKSGHLEGEVFMDLGYTSQEHFNIQLLWAPGLSYENRTKLLEAELDYYKSE